MAHSDGLNYAWIDTCCIDKSSSSELSEAINSMWKWYKNSGICYVYLSDVSLSDVSPKHSKSTVHRLDQSRWFRRGWTLQELLAPDTVVFYDQTWLEIGSKQFLRKALTRICRISPGHLADPTSASIAAKMSWAANRDTTREEDVAYSLLGLFDVNMPLLYGEGKKAFLRLQLEIIQKSSDESIFAWTGENLSFSGLLSESPLAFAKSGNIVASPDIDSPPYRMTNRGLEIELMFPNGAPNVDKEGAHSDALIKCGNSSRPNELIVIRLSVYRRELIRFAYLTSKIFDSADKGTEVQAIERKIVHIPNNSAGLEFPKYTQELPMTIRLEQAARQEQWTVEDISVSTVIETLKWTSDGSLDLPNYWERYSILKLSARGGFTFLLIWAKDYIHGGFRYKNPADPCIWFHTLDPQQETRTTGVNFHTWIDPPAVSLEVSRGTCFFQAEAVSLCGADNHAEFYDCGRDLWLATKLFYEGLDRR